MDYYNLLVVRGHALVRKQGIIDDVVLVKRRLRENHVAVFLSKRSLRRATEKAHRDFISVAVLVNDGAVKFVLRVEVQRHHQQKLILSFGFLEGLLEQELDEELGLRL